MPIFLQRLAARMEIPGSTSLFVQPEDDNSEDWGQFDGEDDNDLLLDDDDDELGFDDEDDDEF